MIAVVGGGLIGACVAFELSQAGEEVVVFDADLPGAAWRAGAGMLSPSGERLEGTLLESDARESLALWPDFARRLEEASGQNVGLRLGLYRVALDDHELGTAGVAPFQHFEAARFHAEEGRVHPPSVRNAALSGLRVVPSRVESIEPSATGVVVRTSAAAFEASAAVLCCGAWSGTFGLPVRALQGQALLLRASPDAPTIYASPATGYALGRPDGVYVGATARETSLSETSPDASAEEELRAKAKGLLGEELGQAPLAQQLVGFRPITDDELPIVGPHPTLSRVFVATGHGRHGVLLAPLTAKRIVQLVQHPKS